MLFASRRRLHCACRCGKAERIDPPPAHPPAEPSRHRGATVCVKWWGRWRTWWRGNIAPPAVPLSYYRRPVLHDFGEIYYSYNNNILFLCLYTQPSKRTSSLYSVLSIARISVRWFNMIPFSKSRKPAREIDVDWGGGCHLHQLRLRGTLKNNQLVPFQILFVYLFYYRNLIILW